MKSILSTKTGKVILPVAGGVLAGVLIFVWWFGIRDSASDILYISGVAPGYKSIESLSNVSDVVIIGTVKRVAGREPYYTGPTDGDIGIPTVFYEVDVNEKLQGEPGDTIIVAQADNNSADVIVSDAGKSLVPGERLLLFLLHRLGSEYGLKKFGDVDDLYVIVSDDNGVFEVSSNEIATPREPYLFRVPGRDDTPEFTLDEIRISVVNELPDGSDDADIGDLITEEPIGTPVSVNE